MSQTEELIQKLKSTKKMCNKYLAKRLKDLDNHRKKREEQLVKDKCYELILDLVDPDTKSRVQKLDAIMKMLKSRAKTEEELAEISSILESCQAEKQNILKGEYNLIHENDRELVELLITYIGYRTEEQVKQK